MTALPREGRRTSVLRFRTTVLVLAAVFVGSIVLTSRLSAAYVDWVNPSGGDWNDSSNWSPGIVPAAADFVSFYLDSSGYTVTALQDATASNLHVYTDDVVFDFNEHTLALTDTDATMYVGVYEDDIARVTLQSGTIEANYFAIGVLAGAQGDLLIDGPTSHLQVGGGGTSDGIAVGSSGSGVLEILSGGRLSTVLGGPNSSVSVGVSTGGSGSIYVSGTGSILQSARNIFVGERGQGELTVTDGASAAAGETLFVGRLADGRGALTVNIGGQLVAESVTVGDLFGSTGAVEVSTGGNVTVTDDLIVGNELGSTGTITVVDIGHLDVKRAIIVGRGGNGELLISNASVTNVGQTQIGGGSSGGVPTNGQGKLTINSGGHLFSFQTGGFASATIAGFSPDAQGEALVSGANSRWWLQESLSVGSVGSGVLRIEDGGHVECTQSRVGRTSTANGSVLIDGVGSLWSISDLLIVGGTDASPGGTANIQVTNGGKITAGQTVKIWQGGAIDVTGGGAVVVGSGSPATTGTLRVGSGGALEGLGTVVGDVLLTGGAVAPGVSIGKLTINGDFAQQSGTLGFEIGGTAPASGYDQLSVNGHAALGGTLQISLLEGFSPASGDSFNILDWNSRSGEFSDVLLPSLGPRKSWDLNQLYTDGIIAVDVRPDPEIIALWTFEAGTAGSPPAGSGTTIGSIAPATGIGSASGFHASAATAWSNPVGNGSTESLSSNNWDIDDYYQFEVSTEGFENIELTFDQLSSSTGPGEFQVQYSTDGSVFTDFGSIYLVRSSSSLAWNSTTYNSTDTFSFDLSAISGLNDQETVFFRVTMASDTAANGGLVASGGTSRIDNVTVLGAPIATSLPGDFDNDGDVDGRDFLLWQRDSSVGDLADWQANYGNTSLTSAASVPEPGFGAPWLCAALLCCCHRFRRQSQ